MVFQTWKVHVLANWRDLSHPRLQAYQKSGGGLVGVISKEGNIMIVARPALERRSAWQRSWKSVLDCNNLVFWQDRSFPTWFPSNLLCVPVCVIWLLYFHSYNFIFALVISGCGLPLCQPLKTTSSANARPWHVDFNFNHVFLSMFITHHVASYYKSYSKFYYKSYYISCYISYYVILPYHLTYHHSRNSGIQYHNIPTNMTWVSSDNARSNCWMRTLGGLLPRQVTWASMQRPTFDMSRSVETVLRHINLATRSVARPVKCGRLSANWSIPHAKLST